MILRLRLVLMSLMVTGVVSAAEPARVGSLVVFWNSLDVQPTPVGERRDVLRNPTATLRELECHVSTLKPGNASHLPHTHPQEELIILRDGELDVHINGSNTKVEAGSLFFFASNDPHAVQNHGDKPATYFVFNFTTAATADRRGQPPLPADPKRLGSSIFHWDKLVAESKPTGLRRAVVDQPTATLANFECHVTTLKPGVAPHAPHRHPDEELLLVKEGELEVSIDGVVSRIGPGSIVLISSGDEHGWKNSGDTDATYYVMRLKTEATPASFAAN